MALGHAGLAMRCDCWCGRAEGVLGAQRSLTVPKGCLSVPIVSVSVLEVPVSVPVVGLVCPHGRSVCP